MSGDNVGFYIPENYLWYFGILCILAFLFTWFSWEDNKQYAILSFIMGIFLMYMFLNNLWKLNLHNSKRIGIKRKIRIKGRKSRRGRKRRFRK